MDIEFLASQSLSLTSQVFPCNSVAIRVGKKKTFYQHLSVFDLVKCFQMFFLTFYEICSYCAFQGDLNYFISIIVLNQRGSLARKSPAHKDRVIWSGASFFTFQVPKFSYGAEVKVSLIVLDYNVSIQATQKLKTRTQVLSLNCLLSQR